MIHIKPLGDYMAAHTLGKVSGKGIRYMFKAVLAVFASLK